MEAHEHAEFVSRDVPTMEHRNAHFRWPRHGDRCLSQLVEENNRRLLRARDAMDRSYAQALDIPALARIACVSEAHFIRTFHATFGETPHRYLQRRRVERSMFLLRETDRSVTDICFDVGFTSLGTFSRTFRDIMGESPSAYRKRGPVRFVPTCFTMAWTRPSSFGEAERD
jgi:AraC-like DNA-binding protein